MNTHSRPSRDEFRTAVALVALAVGGDAPDVHKLLATVDDPGPLILSLIAVASSAVILAHEEMDLDDPALTLRNVALKIANEQEN